jgi:hypothetical protein
VNLDDEFLLGKGMCRRKSAHAANSRVARNLFSCSFSLLCPCSGKVGFSGVALLDNTNQAQHDARGAGSGENDEHSKL